MKVFFLKLNQLFLDAYYNKRSYLKVSFDLGSNIFVAPSPQKKKLGALFSEKA